MLKLGNSKKVRPTKFYKRDVRGLDNTSTGSTSTGSMSTNNVSSMIATTCKKVKRERVITKH
jgi:hypothetical protein